MNESRQRQRASLAAMILAWLAKAGPATAATIASSMRKRVEVIRPRLTEMAALGLVFDTGQRTGGGRRGPREIVWSTERDQSLLGLPEE